MVQKVNAFYVIYKNKTLAKICPLVERISVTNKKFVNPQPSVKNWKENLKSFLETIVTKINSISIKGILKKISLTSKDSDQTLLLILKIKTLKLKINKFQTLIGFPIFQLLPHLKRPKIASRIL